MVEWLLQKNAEAKNRITCKKWSKKAVFEIPELRYFKLGRNTNPRYSNGDLVFGYGFDSQPSMNIIL